MKLKSVNMGMFIKKIDMIQFLQMVYHYDYQEIAYILDDHPKIIETYCNQIIASEEQIKRIKRLKT